MPNLFVGRVKCIAAINGMTLYKLCEMLDISYSKLLSPDIEILKKIHTVFKIDYDYLIEGNEESIKLTGHQLFLN